MINYSVNARKNPRDKEAAPKYYATAQKSQNITLDDIANAISVGTTVTRADVWAVIIAMMEQFMKELKNGNSVKALISSYTKATFSLNLNIILYCNSVKSAVKGDIIKSYVSPHKLCIAYSYVSCIIY